MEISNIHDLLDERNTIITELEEFVDMFEQGVMITEYEDDIINELILDDTAIDRDDWL